MLRLSRRVGASSTEGLRVMMETRKSYPSRRSTPVAVTWDSCSSNGSMKSDSGAFDSNALRIALRPTSFTVPLLQDHAISDRLLDEIIYDSLDLQIVETFPWLSVSLRCAI